MSSDGAAPRAAVSVSSARAEASRTNGRQVARAEDARRQGALGAECPQARHARAEARAAPGRGCRRVRHARGGADRGAAAGRGAADRARAARRGRHVPSGAGGSVGRRNGVGAPFPNSAATDRAVRGAAGRAWRAWARPDPRRQRRAVVRDGWREPAPTLVVGALRPTAIAARPWPSSGARRARSRRSRPSRRRQRTCAWQRRRLYARNRSDPPRARRSPIAPHQTNPSATPSLHLSLDFEYVLPDRPGPGGTLHEPAALWTPNEP